MKAIPLFYSSRFVYMYPYIHIYLSLKELRNCILCIICVWSLFCSVRVYISLHFLPILLVILDFRLPEF